MVFINQTFHFYSFYLKKKNMSLIKLYLAIAITIINISEIFCHGMLMEPVNRGSAWKKNFKTPINYDDDGNYCGGYSVLFIIHL